MHAPAARAAPLILVASYLPKIPHRNGSLAQFPIKKLRGGLSLFFSPLFFFFLMVTSRFLDEKSAPQLAV